MRYRTRMIAAAAVTAALAAGSTAALASTTGAKPGPGAKAAASGKPAHAKAAQPAGDEQVHAMITAAVAGELHVSTARAGAALRPLFAAGRAETSSPAFVEAAHSLGVSSQQLAAALAHAKQSVAVGTHANRSAGGSKAGGSKAVGSKSAEERQGHNAMTAAVAGELHVSAARAGAALRPLFAAGRAETSSPAFVAAAHSLGVSPQQLAAALMHAKQSLAAGS